MPVKSSHRLNGFSTNGCDTDEVKTEVNDEENECEKEVLDERYNLTNQLKQLNEGIHPEYCKASKRAEKWLADQKLRIQILHEYRVCWLFAFPPIIIQIDEVHSQYDREIQTCERDCMIEKKRIQEYLVALCEDLKRRLEHDKNNIELTPSGDVLDLKPTVTRKLRRRTLDVSGCNTKLNYWGDILLNSSSWLTPSAANRVLNSHDVIQSSSLPTFTSVSPQPFRTGDSELDVSASGISLSANQNTSVTASSYVGSNLFGSLGVNVDDNSLMTHLLASLNSASEAGSLSPSGALFASAINQSSRISTSVSGASLTPSASCPLGPMSYTLGLQNSAVPSTSYFGSALPSSSKRRKQQNSQLFTQLSLLLPENDIYSDLTIIHRACGKPPTTSCPKKVSGPVTPGTGSGLSCPEGNSSIRRAGSPLSRKQDASASNRDASTPESVSCRRREQYTSESCSTTNSSNKLPPPSVWIDDGRLYCGQVCFQTGASVFLEGHGCSGTIVAIGAQDVSIKRLSDLGIIRVTVQQLKHGRYSLVLLKSR